jgi:hypothetical protein
MKGGPNKITMPFAARPVAMLGTAAYRVLSRSAHMVLARVEIENHLHAGVENGRLIITYDNFEEYGIDRHSIAPAIRELVALGFLTVRKQRLDAYRTVNVFRLTYRHAKGQRGDGTHEWLHLAIETVEQAQKIARQARAAKDETNIRVRRKQQVVGGGKYQGQWGKPSPQAAVGDTPTLGPVREIPTTIDISGGVGGRGPEGGRTPTLTEADVAPTPSPTAETLMLVTGGLSGEAAE